MITIRVSRLGHRIEAENPSSNQGSQEHYPDCAFSNDVPDWCDVSGRYFFNHPIKGTIYHRIVLVLVVFFATADVAYRKTHIMVNLITSRFSKRLQTIVNTATSLASLVIAGLIAWQLGAAGLGSNAPSNPVHPASRNTTRPLPAGSSSGQFAAVASAGGKFLS